MKLSNYTRDVETGDPFTTGSVEILKPDGSTLTTVGLNAVSGLWTYSANGQPGKTTSIYTGSGQTREIAGDTSIQQGDLFLGELTEIFKFISDGVISGMALSAPGGMNVRVGIGSQMILGRFNPVYAAEDLVIGAAHATLPRIDAVVGRLTRTGTFAGRIILAVVAGTAAATPTPPALTQTADTWEVKLGEVAVAAAAVAITSGNLSTTGRRFAGVPGRQLVYANAFSASTGFTADEVFNTDHRYYDMAIAINAASIDGVNLYWQFRAGRANVATAGYSWAYSGRTNDGGGASVNADGAAQTQMVIYTGLDTAADSFFEGQIWNPMDATVRSTVSWHGSGQDVAGDVETINGSGVLNALVAHDGFRLYPSSGNFTGEIMIWGKGKAV